MKRWIYRTWSVALAAAAVGSAAASAHAAATLPARPPEVMRESYENVPADSILRDLARVYGLVILKDVPTDMRISVRIPEEGGIDSAVAALKEILVPLGVSLQPGDAAGRIWKVAAATAQDKEQLAAARRAGEAVLLAPRDNTMKFQFVDAPIEAILDEVSHTLGIEIDRAAPVPGRITIYVPNPVNASEAMQLLNAILAPSGYTSMEIERYAPDGTPRPAVRVWTIQDAKKGAIPVE